MAITDYTTIKTALFVKITVDEYLQPGELFDLQPETLRFSDHHVDYELFPGETYTALGTLLNVTSTTRELTPTGSNVSITISGIPQFSTDAIVRSKIKASPVTIHRAFFDQDGTLINDGTTVNPVGRWNGFINNYTLQEEFDSQRRLITNTILLDCSSNVDVLSRKVGGRKTNPNSMRKYFPFDASFDRVPALVGEPIKFGGGV